MLPLVVVWKKISLKKIKESISGFDIVWKHGEDVK